MSLIRWNPNTRVRRFGDDVDRIFEDLMHVWGQPNPGPGRGDLMPPVNLHETNTHVIIDVELPGMEGGDVDISVHDKTLIIKGDKKSEHEEGGAGKNFYRYERAFGSFQRRVPLPCAVESEAAEAKLDKGVLHLSLPKHKESSATKIGVKTVP